MDVNFPSVLEGVHITKIVRANELDFPHLTSSRPNICLKILAVAAHSLITPH